MENVFCSLYTQSSMEPAAEKAALQELLLHLGQEAAQQHNCKRYNNHCRIGLQFIIKWIQHFLFLSNHCKQLYFRRSQGTDM